MNYRYRGLDSRGKRVAGTVPASSMGDARLMLGNEGIVILSISKASRFMAWLTTSAVRGRAKDKHRVEVLLALATGAASQMSFVASADVAIQSLPRRSTARVALEKVREQATAGAEPEAAMATASSHLGEDLTAIYAAATRTQNPEAPMLEMAAIIEQGARVGSSMRGAMIQPVFTLAIVAVASVLMLILALPEFEAMYSDFGQDLPLITRSMMGLSDVLRANLSAFGIGVALLVGCGLWMWFSPAWRPRISRMADRLPMLGKVRVSLTVQRVASMIGVLLTAEVPQVQTLRIVAQSLPSPWARSLVEKAAADLPERGFVPSVELHLEKLDPSLAMLARQSAQVGSDPGAPWMRFAKMRRQATEQMVSNLADTMQPVLGIFTAGVVMLLSLAIYLPMFGMFDVMNQGAG